MPWELLVEKYGIARFQVSGIEVAGPCHYFVEQVSKPTHSRRVRGTIDLHGEQAALERIKSALEPSQTINAVLMLGEVRLKAWGTYLDDAELLDFGSFDRAGIERLMRSA